MERRGGNPVTAPGRAADLSVGSVVASAIETFMNVERDPDGNAWYSTDSGTGFIHGDDRIDEELRNGAQVLRVGDGR